MIKQAGILLTLCATSLVVINIRTLESETLPDDRPALIETTETCLVARWAGHPGAFSSSWDLSARYKKEQEIALGVARLLSRYNLSATFYLAVDELDDSQESSCARLVVRRLAERVKTDEADRESAGEGAAAAPEAPGLHFFQIRLSKAQIRVLAGVSRPGAQKFKRGWLG